MVIGVTGGIASGKSSVCRMLADMGLVHIDADDVAHHVLEIPSVAVDLYEKFGNGIIVAQENENNEIRIDRKKLSALVFQDNEKMRILEGITRPKIVELIKNEITQNPERNFVIEGIALVSTGIYKEFDELWVVHVDPEQQLKRLMNNRGMSYEAAVDRLKSQEDHDWDENTADRIIYSTEPIETMEKQVQVAFKKIQEKINSESEAGNH